MLDAFIGTVFRGYLWILISAMAGAYYLINNKNIPRVNRLFVYFLWVTFIIDLLGFYFLVAYYSDYRIFGFVKNTVFEENHWLYNSFKPVAFVIYFFFFISQLNSYSLRQVLSWVAVIFFVACYLNMIIFGNFFGAYSAFTPIVGTVILLFCIAFYFFQILTSENILNFYGELPFYIAVGALLWHLSITPLFIYNKLEIMTSSPNFVQFYLKMLGIMNFIMYGTYTLGFIVITRRNRKKLIIDPS